MKLQEQEVGPLTTHPNPSTNNVQAAAGLFLFLGGRAGGLFIKTSH